MGFRPTVEQVYPADLIRTGNDALVIAFAGTGKSTTLVYIANEFPNKRMLYVTFGKENINEGRRKFPKSNVYCATAHSLAFQEINSRLNLVENRLLTSSISIDDFINAMGLDYSTYYERIRIIITVTLAKNIIHSFCKSTDYKINRTHIPISEMSVSDDDENSAFELAIGYWQKVECGQVQMTHDMYLKLWHLTRPVLKYDLILFDEAQDGDAVMVDVINNQSCQKIAVGDHHQQIYSFRGAINALKVLNINNTCYLTQSFRYGHNIAQLANKLLLDHKGVSAGIKGNPALRSEVETYYNPHDVFIGRTLKSLFSKMFDMHEGGYDDFTCLADTKNMIDVIYGIVALRKGTQVYHPFLRGFDTYEEFETYCAYSEGEMIPTYNAIINDHGASKVIGLLKQLGSKKRGQTTFITAHKSKGLEFNYVTLLDDFTDLESDHYNNEETNLLYVASTRGIKGVNVHMCEPIMDVMRR